MGFVKFFLKLKHNLLEKDFFWKFDLFLTSLLFTVSVRAVRNARRHLGQPGAVTFMPSGG